MKKIPAVVITLLILIISTYIVLVNFALDNSQIRKEVASLLSNNNTVSLDDYHTKTVIFPYPAITIDNIDILGILSAQELTVVFDMWSIIKLNPKISRITANSDHYKLEATAIYENSNYEYSKVKIFIKNPSHIFASSKLLTRVIESLAIKEMMNLEFNTVRTNDSTTLTNMTISTGSTRGSGIVTLANTDGEIKKITLTFDQINIHNECLKDINVVADFNNQSNRAISITANICGADGGILKITGNVTENDFRPIFSGYINLHHNDCGSLLKHLVNEDGELNSDSIKATCDIASDIAVTEMEWALKNMQFTLSDMQIVGEIGIKFIGNTPRIYADLAAQNFNISTRYPVISEVTDYITTLFNDCASKDYINKFKPISNIKYIGLFNIAVSTTKLSDQPGSLAFKCDMSSNLINCSNIDYNGYYGSIKDASIKLNTNTIKPSMTLSASKVDLKQEFLPINNFLKPGTMSLFTKIETDIDIPQLTISKYPSFGEMSVNASSRDNILMINKVQSHYKDCTRNVNGNATITDTINVNLNYGLDHFHLSDLTKFIHSIDISGYLNTNGVLSTYGNTIEDLLYNLHASGAFITSNIDINHYGVDDMVKKLNASNYTSNDLTLDVKDTVSNGVSSVSKASGSYEIYNGMITTKDTLLTSKVFSSSVAAAYNIYNGDYTISSKLSFYMSATENNKIPTIIGIEKKMVNSVTDMILDIESLKEIFASRYGK